MKNEHVFTTFHGVLAKVSQMFLPVWTILENLRHGLTYYHIFLLLKDILLFHRSNHGNSDFWNHAK
jgi:hypothetical protein